MVAPGTAILTSTIPKCSFSPTAAMPFFKRAIVARPVSASSSSMLAIFRLGLGWSKTSWMLCVGPWIKGSPIQSESRRWEDRWEVSPRLARWRRRAGDADHDENWNRKISPLFHVDAIRAPLLIVQGKNDPRVTMANADAMVAALRKAKRDVTYVVYPDEGHGFARPENQFDFYGRGEEFLAKHLGGRAVPGKKIPGATGEQR